MQRLNLSPIGLSLAEHRSFGMSDLAQQRLESLDGRYTSLYRSNDIVKLSVLARSSGIRRSWVAGSPIRQSRLTRVGRQHGRQGSETRAGRYRSSWRGTEEIAQIRCDRLHAMLVK